MLALIRRLLRLEAGVAIGQALADHFIDRGFRWLSVLAAGGVMSYLAAATAWVNNFGPIAWGIAFFAGAFAALGVWGMMVWVSKRWMLNRFAARAHTAGNVNILAPSFEGQRIMVTQFYNPYYVPCTGARFHRCQVWGPANVFLSGAGFIMKGMHWKHCQVIVVRPDMTLYGAVHFHDCIFTEGEFCDVTLIMTLDQYLHTCATAPGFREYVPVLNYGWSLTSPPIGPLPNVAGP